jgi:hypothetical protein
MLGVYYLVEVLRLVAVLTSHIPLNPLLLFPPPRLKGVVLSVDLVEPLGASTWHVIEPTAKETAIETIA